MEPLVGSSSYDVFINFRGVDTRNTLVGYLHMALKDRGIHAFIDSNDLWKGDDIEPALLRAIKGSKLSISVFSERYAESSWCLRELTQMLECHRADGQLIFPIFFKVKTSDVKNQTGCFEISPQRHGKEAPQTLQRWKDTLRVIGDKSGWVFDDDGDLSALVRLVVQRTWIRLSMVPLIGVEHPVGLESRIESLLSLLSKSSSTDVQLLGICGMGGIGKTTIAAAIYNCIFENFSKSCFLEDVREQASQSNGIICLQEKLLHGICDEKVNICSSREGSRLIQKRLGKIDTLLILDDVGNRKQLDAFAGDLNWFGPRSRIIVTTRDRSILSGVPENKRKIYEPEELNEEESLRLFSSYAFSADQPPDDFLQLSVGIVHTTGGLPLALEVLGSDLSTKKDIEVWKSMQRILEKVPHNDVYGKLKISYDNLQDDIEKAMFLDAACFFIGWRKETVLLIWEACGFEPRYYMEVLKEKSLLTFRAPNRWEKEKLWMHDQIRDMGRRIAYNKKPMDPANHIRLWSRDNIMKVLNSGKGNEMVEGLLLRFTANECLHTKGFKKMPKLRLLQVDGATLKGSFHCLPSGLRWLRWWDCPLEKLPSNFYHEELVVLDLTGGKFRQVDWGNWLENKLFQQLKVLKLSCCRDLSKSPDFSGFPRLESLYLDDCTDLGNLHQSIGQLHQLIYLNLSHCFCLEKLPNSICRLRSLQKLILTHCMSLLELPSSIGDLKESLVELSLDYLNFRALPDGVRLLKKLEVLDLSHCGRLVHLPRSLENMTSLHYILLNGCAKLRYIPKFPSNLIELRVFCKSLLSFTEMHNAKNLLLLCLKNLCVKAEQFRGTVMTSYCALKISVLGTVHQICVYYSWLWLTHGQGTAFQQGNSIDRGQVWIRCLRVTDEGPSCKYLIPDDDDHDEEICSSRLTMLVSLRISEIGEDVEIRSGNLLRVNTTLKFKACIYWKDQRKTTTYCETRLRIEGLKLINRDMDHIHQFQEFDWFGFQLEAGDTIEILQVDQEDNPADDDGYGHECGMKCTVTEVNLFLMKGNLLKTHYSSLLLGSVLKNGIRN